MAKQIPIQITDSQFEDQIIKRKGISIIDFWAPWCGPCITMAPALEAFAATNGEKVKVFKLDVDDNPKTAEKYQIRSVPTIIFFKDGEPVDITAGAMSESALQEKLDNLLNQNSF
jgi:thioredoxin 1